MTLSLLLMAFKVLPKFLHPGVEQFSRFAVIDCGGCGGGGGSGGYITDVQ